MGSSTTPANACMTGSALKPSAYAGDVTPREAFDALSAQAAVLVDVRTPQEWQAGQPDLSATPSKMFSVSWKTGPDYALNPRFAEELLGSGALHKETPIYFLCKGGGRSQEASIALTAAGYQCFNIRGGFEGRPDVAGWKDNQLPWKKG